MMDPDQMTFDDLSAVYRAEMRSQMLSDVRKDLYPSLMRLQDSIRKDYETALSKDPDSILCEGLNERRKKAAFFIHQVVDLRMSKITKMALRAGDTANVIDKLTIEEREYYNDIVAGSKRLRSNAIKDAKRYVIPDISSNVEEKKVTEDVPKNVRTAEEDIPSDISSSAPAAVTASAVADVDDVPKDIPVNDPFDDISGDISDDPESMPRDVFDDVPEDAEVIEEAEEHEDMVVIRILEDLPKIPGPDRDYILKKEDIVRMPAAFADTLIKHEKAVLLNVTP